MAEKGRTGAVDRFINTVAEQSATQAMLIKQDELIDTLKDLAEKLDGDGGVGDNDYRVELTNALEKVVLR